MAGSPFDAAAEVGVSAGSIKIGIVNAQSGPSKGLGIELRQGSEAYLNKVNAAGGVNGRKIELIVGDDGYEPERTALETRRMIDEEHVFALFDYVGTPTGKAAVPILSEAGVPLIGMFTGAEAFRNPVNKNIFHIRGSYWDETEEMVKHLVDDLGIREIGSFAQDDAFGVAVESGIVRALAKRGLHLKGRAKFKRNTTEVSDGLEKLMKAGPKAVVLSGAYSSCSAIMKNASERGFKPLFLNVSFVGTRELIRYAGKSAEGGYITQVMPSYMDTGYSLVKDYRRDMKAAGLSEGDLGYGSLEGYANAVVLVEALKRAGRDLTRDGLRNAMESMRDFDLGGITVSYGPSDHQGLKRIFLTEVMAGKPVSVSRMERH